MSNPLDLALERIKAARLAYIQGQIERQEREDKDSRQAFYLGYDCALNRSLLLPVGGEPVWSEPQTNGMFEPGQPVSGDARSAGKPAGSIPPLLTPIEREALRVKILFSVPDGAEFVYFLAGDRAPQEVFRLPSLASFCYLRNLGNGFQIILQLGYLLRYTSGQVTDYPIDSSDLFSSTLRYLGEGWILSETLTNSLENSSPGLVSTVFNPRPVYGQQERGWPERAVVGEVTATANSHLTTADYGSEFWIQGESILSSGAGSYRRQVVAGDLSEGVSTWEENNNWVTQLTNETSFNNVAHSHYSMRHLNYSTVEYEQQTFYKVARSLFANDTRSMSLYLLQEYEMTRDLTTTKSLTQKSEARWSLPDGDFPASPPFDFSSFLSNRTLGSSMSWVGRNIYVVDIQRFKNSPTEKKISISQYSPPASTRQEFEENIEPIPETFSRSSGFRVHAISYHP